MNQKNLDLAIELRHELHQHPELSNQETWTKNHLMEFLKMHTKLEVVDRGLWFYAAYLAGEGKKTIAYRGDFDAIPTMDDIDKPYKSKFDGIGHKCGHDGHVATLAALALEIDQNGCDKNVYFVFQHAEEIGDGAKYCAELMDEKHVDEIFAFHNQSGIPKKAVVLRNNTLCCASKGMELKFTGVPAHASTPENGKNPALAIANIIQAIPDFISVERNKGIVLATVIQVDLGERAFGCSASKGSLLLTIRGEFEEEMNRLQKNLEELAKSEGEKYGLSVEFGFYDEFPETSNHPESADRVRAACKKLGIQCIEQDLPTRGSEDFGYFTKRTKGAIFWLGNGEDYPPVHSKEFDFLDETIAVAVDVFLELAQ